MKRLAFGVAFLLACNAATVPVTFTPAPNIVLPTVRPYQTVTPFVTQVPDPTPSQEVTNWTCNSINGWTLSPHCGLNPYFIPVNPNSDLITSTSKTTLQVQGPQGVIYRDVDYPGPPSLYTWVFNTNGFNGREAIVGLPPIVRFAGNGFEVNVTGLTGSIFLRLEQAELFAIPGRYVVGFEMTPNVSVPDSARNNPAIMTKQCRIRTYNGKTYELAVQNAGHNGYQPILDSAVYVISMNSSITIMLECGILLAQPVFNGTVMLERFFVEPVPEDYGDIVTRID